ncbi:hypothetical protein RRG08_021988 [Elysia crispata]|uniref:Uncharacterized protein n=1 Tax=Elysia crispata TaxID=231223 RepID=A0AAE0XSU7_9GAST|nr:hypothetical protein RRG08_021988 [Elysia crispata]
MAVYQKQLFLEQFNSSGASWVRLQTCSSPVELPLPETVNFLNFIFIPKVSQCCLNTSKLRAAWHGANPYIEMDRIQAGISEGKIPQIGRSIVTDNTNRDFRPGVNAGHKSLQSVVTARVWPLHLGYGRLQDLVTAACHQTTEAWGSLSSAQVRHNFPAPRIGGPHGELDMKLFKPVGRFLFFDRVLSLAFMRMHRSRLIIYPGKGQLALLSLLIRMQRRGNREELRYRLLLDHCPVALIRRYFLGWFLAELGVRFHKTWS